MPGMSEALPDPEPESLEAYMQRLGEESDFPDPPLALPTEEGLPLPERFPRQMLFEFADDHTKPKVPVNRIRLLQATPNAFPNGPILYHGKRQGFTVGEQVGNALDDNARVNDGFRFHDALHIATTTITGWSAVTRALLRIKRRSLPDVDRIQDGARAIQLEEHLFTKLGVGTVQGESSMFADLTIGMAISTTRLDLAKVLPENTFIGHREWEKAIKIGYNVLYLLKDSIGVINDTDAEVIKRAYLYADLDQAELRFSIESPEAAKLADPVAPINPLFYPG